MTSAVRAASSELLASAARGEWACANEARYSYFDGPIDLVMGGTGFFSFRPSEIFPGDRGGDTRLLSKLLMWLAAQTNSSAW